MAVVKESDVTERLIHTGGEQIQGNETRNFRDRGGRESAKGGGGGGELESTIPLAWTMTHDEPRRSRK